MAHLTEARLAELVAADIAAATACHDWCMAQPSDYAGPPRKDLAEASYRAEVAVQEYRRALREQNQAN